MKSHIPLPLMRTTSLLCAVLLAACAPDPVAPVTHPNLARAAAGPASYVVQTADASLAPRHGVVPTRRYAHVLRGFAARLTDSQVAALRAEGATVTPDGVVTLHSVPSWGLDRVDQRPVALDGVFVPPATGAGVTIYMVDTGINYAHQDFGGRAVFGWDWEGLDGSDCYGHGTHTAGTAGGATFGVATGVRLVSVRVFGCTGSQDTSVILAALDWVFANATLPAVVNMSLGTTPPDPLFDAAAQALLDRGVVVVASAGNANRDACDVSPARVPGVITVGSTDLTDSRANSSNWGNCLDIFAPGVGITSADYLTTTGSRGMSGTSMAAPHVSGDAALLLAQMPGLTPALVDSVIFARSTKRVVGGSFSAKPHLLYTGLDDMADPGPPPPPPAAPPAPTGLAVQVLSLAGKGKTATATLRATWNPNVCVSECSSYVHYKSAAVSTYLYAAPGVYQIDFTVPQDVYDVTVFAALRYLTGAINGPESAPVRVLACTRCR